MNKEQLPDGRYFAKFLDQELYLVEKCGTNGFLEMASPNGNNLSVQKKNFQLRWMLIHFRLIENTHAKRRFQNGKA